METQLLNILNTDAQVRKEASETVNRMCTESPIDSAKLMLKTIIENQTNQKLMEIASLVLHKNILSKQDLFEKIPDLVLNEILTKLVEFVFTTNQLTLSLANRSSEICMEITIKKNLHKNVLEMISSNLQSSQNQNNQNVKIFVLYSMELLCTFTNDQTLLKNTSMQILPYIQNQLNDANTDVQVQAAIAITMLMNNIKEPEYLQNFQGAVQKLVSLIIKVVKEKDSQKSIKIIDSFDELTAAQSKFMTPLTNDLLTVFTDIVACEDFDEGVRIAAVNYIATICQSMPASVKTSEVFNQKTLVVLYQTLMNSTTEELLDESMGNKNFTEKTISEKNLYGAVIMTFSVFTYTLSGRYSLKAMMPFCKQGLQSQDWKAQNTALVLIGVLSENTKKHFEKDLEQTMNLVLPYLNSTNNKVRFSCLTCLALMCDEYTPEIQKNFGKQILDSLLSMMNNQDESLINLNVRAVSCLINFSRELLKSEIEEDLQEDYSFIFEAHFDQITNSILNLIQYSVEKSNFTLLTEVLALVSILSNLMKQKFKAHYQQFMTQFKTLLGKLQGAQLNDQQKNLKCYLIDTCGFLISVNCKDLETVKEDLTQLFQFLTQEIKQVDKESPILKSALSFYTLVGKNLHDNFLPLLNQVYDLATTCASQTVDIHLEDQENFQGVNSNYKTLNLDLKIYGGKKVLSINHAILANKVAGFECLGQLFKHFSSNLSQDQFQQTFQLVKTHLENVHSSSIKEQCMKILKKLILRLPYDQALQAFNQVSSPILNYINKYFNTENNQQLLDYLRQYNKLLGALNQSNKRGLPQQLQPPSNLSENFDIINKIITTSKTLKQELIQDYDQMDLQQEDIKEEFDCEFEYFSNFDLRAMELASELLKFNLNQEQENLILNSIGQYFKTLAQQPKVVVEALAGLSFFIDVIEFASDQGRQMYFEMTYQLVMQELTNPKYSDDDYTQTLYYCLGCLMYAAPQSTPENVTRSSVSMLSSYLNNNQKNDQNSEIYENVIAAILKTYLVHHQTLNQDCEQVLTQLYSMFPLTTDLEESKTVNRFIVLGVKNQNAFLMGNENRQKLTQQYLTKLKKYVAQNNNVEVTDDFVNEFLKSVNQ